MEKMIKEKDDKNMSFSLMDAYCDLDGSSGHSSCVLLALPLVKKRP